MTLLNTPPPTRTLPPVRHNAARSQLVEVVNARVLTRWRFGRGLTFAIAIGVMVTGSAAAGVLIPSQRAEAPNATIVVKAQQLSSMLTREFPSQFAGLTLSNHNSMVNVYVTKLSSELTSAMNKLAPRAAMKINIVSNTWNTLMAVQHQLEVAMPALQARGIRTNDISADVSTNKVIIEVVNLTTAQRAILQREFGANQINVQGINADRASVPLGTTW